MRDIKNMDPDEKGSREIWEGQKEGNHNQNIQHEKTLFLIQAKAKKQQKYKTLLQTSRSTDLQTHLSLPSICLLVRGEHSIVQVTMPTVWMLIPRPGKAHTPVFVSVFLS